MSVFWGGVGREDRKRRSAAFDTGVFVHDQGILIIPWIKYQISKSFTQGRFTAFQQH